MGCLNPFAQYMIKEMQAQEVSEKSWELDEQIFKKAPGAVPKENLCKTSAEMFCIYKYTNDPHMRVKSGRYCKTADFVECRELLPAEEATLFENSILNELQSKTELQMPTVESEPF